MMLDNGHTFITFLEFELGPGWRWRKVPYNFYLLQCHDVVISAFKTSYLRVGRSIKIFLLLKILSYSLLEKETFRIMMSCSALLDQEVFDLHSNDIFVTLNYVKNFFLTT